MSYTQTSKRRQPAQIDSELYGQLLVERMNILNEIQALRPARTQEDAARLGRLRARQIQIQDIIRNGGGR